MVDKIYKYRPLSDFLFKELFYNELYFASYSELNDPLDLTVKLNFKPTDAKRLDYLIYSLIKISILPLFEEHIQNVKVKPTQNLLKFAKNIELRSVLCKKLFSQLPINDEFITYNQIIEKLKPLSKENDLNFRFEAYEKEIERLTEIFFQSSFSTSFSKTYSDFLMWSHYSSKHQGICLEFTLGNKETFPYIKTAPRTTNKKKYKERYSEWESKIGIFWDRIHKIEYVPELPTINYFDFAPVFENEGTLDWKYEEEWRAIEINFENNKQPESRIRHYPNEALTRVYFGIRTPNNIKERIYQIISNQNSETDFYVAKLTDKRELDFEEWFSKIEE